MTKEHEGDRRFPVPLFHGTSTLFLDGILKHGLGGQNPVAEWRILDLAREIYPLVEEHLAGEEAFMIQALSFGKMVVQQQDAVMNFQHGDTYLSPERSTAIRYASTNRYGSELLTSTLLMLRELLRRKVPRIVYEIFRRYRGIYGMLDIGAAPVLIRLDEVDVDALLTEDGQDPAGSIELVREVTARKKGVRPSIVDTFDEGGELQQTNFRLRRAIPATALKIWLVNVTRWDPYGGPDYSLHEIRPEPSHVQMGFEKS